MANTYLLIESRDPLESKDSHEYLFALATTMARSGIEVAVFLVQNGTFAARRGAHQGALTAASEAGVKVFADEFSLRERGIGIDGLAPTVRTATLELVVDRLAGGSRVIWH